MKFKRLIRTFRKLLIKMVKVEFKNDVSLDGCVDDVTVDMIKAIYAAYHGLENVESIEDSDMITDWACSVLGQIQRGLAE